MPRSEFIVETNPTPEQVRYQEDRLYEFNSRTTGITDGQGLGIFELDDRNRIVAGICGHTWGGCCEISQFWVEESRRGKGLGTKLELFRAEDRLHHRFRFGRGRCRRFFGRFSLGFNSFFYSLQVF